ncbi:MAG TPA: hypothetical protein VJV78_20910 [Polyangiales bacterium]|nr:hypothetical protein [Polyangiales bacterium]
MRSAWTVVSCDGEELARGESSGTWQCGSTLVPLNYTTMRWPGMEEPQSAVSVTSPIGMRQARPAQILELSLFTATEEQTQQAVIGDDCN